MVQKQSRFLNLIAWKPMILNLVIRRKMTTIYSCKTKEKIRKTYTLDNLIKPKVMIILNWTRMGDLMTIQVKSQVSPEPMKTCSESLENLKVLTQCKEDMKRASHNLKLTWLIFLKNIKTKPLALTRDLVPGCKQGWVLKIYCQTSQDI